MVFPLFPLPFLGAYLTSQRKVLVAVRVVLSLVDCWLWGQQLSRCCLSVVFFLVFVLLNLMLVKVVGRAALNRVIFADNFLRLCFVERKSSALIRQLICGILERGV